MCSKGGVMDQTKFDSKNLSAVPPRPSAPPPDIRDIAATSQDAEDIFQYLLDMPMPFLQWSFLLNFLTKNSVPKLCPLVRGFENFLKLIKSQKLKRRKSNKTN